MYESNSISALNGTYTYAELKAGDRRIVSLEESEQTEKTLHHLAGRVEELRARLERVLIPAGNSVGASATIQDKEPATSPLSQRLKSFRKLAQTSIDTVEDILNRLDV